MQAFPLHQGDVSAVAFTPDGQQILSVGVDGAAWAWNITTAAAPRIFLRQPLDPVHAFRVTMADGTQQIGTEKFSSVDMSPDGQMVAIGTNENRVLLVEVATGTIRHVFQGAVQGIFAPEIVQLVFSPDGQFLASKEALAGVSLWDIHQRRLLHAFNGSDPSVQSQVFSMGFSANRATLFFVVHSTGLYDRWVLPNGPYQIAANDQHLDEIVGVGGNAHVVSAAMSQDGALAALGGGTVYDDYFTGLAHMLFGPRNDPRIFVYRSGAVTPIMILRGHGDNISGIVFSPDATLLASVSKDATLRLWRIAN
jgi:WD40 repeat protein